MTTEHDQASRAQVAPVMVTVSTPLTVFTRTARRCVRSGPGTSIRIIVVREGSTVLTTNNATRPISVGHVAVVGPDASCTSEPEGEVTATVVHVAVDYVADQVFWQYQGLFHDRQHACELITRFYTDQALVLRLDEPTLERLLTHLDAMVELSNGGITNTNFHHLLAHWFSIANIVLPHAREPRALVGTPRAVSGEDARTLPRRPRTRREAIVVRDALQRSPEQPWTMTRMAEMAHLSPKQLSRVFLATFGTTPTAYLTDLRAERMARLLCETNVPAAEAGRQVGWRSRSRASEAFKRHTGMTPQEYRRRLA
ncbi:MAG: AraC family transcriptional regulator [Propionibacterium sp.]|nr:AraC family transcriptional regulator [Propionibacterium sp.]